MGLFKNEVGRPSNEFLKKRRIVYLIIALFVVGIVGVGIFYVKKEFRIDNVTYL